MAGLSSRVDAADSFSISGVAAAGAGATRCSGWAHWACTSSAHDPPSAYLINGANDVADTAAEMLFASPPLIERNGTTYPVWMTGASATQRMRVWLAVGLLTGHAGLSSADALAVLRAYAYGNRLTLDDVAEAVTIRQLDPRRSRRCLKALIGEELLQVRSPVLDRSQLAQQCDATSVAVLVKEAGRPSLASAKESWLACSMSSAQFGFRAEAPCSAPTRQLRTSAMVSVSRPMLAASMRAWFGSCPAQQ